ncbi:2,3-bisphosphoglycerate-independent phosphoglycerate mutase [Pseudomonadota bacterium]
MSVRHKGLIMVLDGLGDRPSPQLDGKTPLEAAHTPHMNALATAGMCGMVDPLSPGIPVATHTGTGLMLGLAPRDAITLPRGPVEAAGIGLAIKPGDLAIRCNFATLGATASGGLKVIDRRAGRISEGTAELATVLQGIPLGDGISASVRPSTQHRAVLHLSGPGLSESITDTDPGDDQLPEDIPLSRPLTPEDPAAVRTAAALNRFIQEAHTRLQEHPVNRKRLEQGLTLANGILTRGAGMLQDVCNLINRLELKAALIAGEGSVIGLGRLFDFTVIEDPRFTALPDTDLQAKINATREALEDHDIVFLHIKAPDICAHDFDPQCKKELLERLDQLLPTLTQDGVVIGISGDHSTDSTTGHHCGDPVPSIIHNPLGRRDGCTEYGETQCMHGGLGRISATGFLLSLLDNMGAMHSFKPGDDIFFSTSPN